ncbi:MAG TPA: hypothetical protein VGN80_00370 [Devosiaceae bacterium]|jgi:hypothetical protein|nr:hypothetical protein [Devosiaceae bacterium]
MGEIAVLLTVPLTLILTARHRFLVVDNYSGALAAYLPSALAFALVLSIACSGFLIWIPSGFPKSFLAFTARFLRLFTLGMLLVALVFLLQELQALPVWLLPPSFALSANDLSDDNKAFLTAWHAGTGIAAWWLLLLSRLAFRLLPIYRKHPARLRRDINIVIDPFLLGVVVPACIVLTTHVVFWYKLPAWLAVRLV